MQNSIVTTLHDTPYLGSHLGIGKTYEAISYNYFWPDIYKTVAQIVRTCPVCQKIKTQV